MEAAHHPLIITSYLGRNPRAVPCLVDLATSLAIPVYLSCPTNMSFPMTHPLFVGLSYGMGENKWLREADVILVIDSDIPWITMHNKPRPDARIFHIDVDVLKQNMGMFHLDAEIRAQADGELALRAILQEVSKLQAKNDMTVLRHNSVVSAHNKWVATVTDAEGPSKSSIITVPHVISMLRTTAPPKTLFLNESVSNFVPVWSHLLPTRPGSAFSSGASSLGWGLGAAIGASIGRTANPETSDNEFIALVVGDGSFLFGVPSSAYWIARRYETVSLLGKGLFCDSQLISNYPAIPDCGFEQWRLEGRSPVSLSGFSLKRNYASLPSSPCLACIPMVPAAKRRAQISM